MIDLVERLRLIADCAAANEAKTLRDAANEIERLHADMATTAKRQIYACTMRCQKIADLYRIECYDAESRGAEECCDVLFAMCQK